jgi:hypothetical protein
MKKEGDSAGGTGSNAVRLKVGKRERVFDVDDPKLPDWVDKKALGSGGYPYDKRMREDEYV